MSKTSGPTLAYDPAGRLATIAGFGTGTATTRFDYDGTDLIAESDASGALTRRYVHGPGTDEPLLWYEGSGTADRRFLAGDERGSVTSITDANGGVLGINAYDENGVPAQRNIGRFGYTGQAWLPEVNLAYYKARMYDPSLGRFLQSDPIGYAAGMNLYAYVRGDPVNRYDPSGLVYQDCSYGFSRSEWLTDSAGLVTWIKTTDYFTCQTRYEESDFGSRYGVAAGGTQRANGGRGSAASSANGNLRASLSPAAAVLPKLPFDRAIKPGMYVDRCTAVPDIFPRSCNAHDVCLQTRGTTPSQCNNEFWYNMNAERPDLNKAVQDSQNSEYPMAHPRDIYYFGVIIFVRPALWIGRLLGR